MAKGQILAFLVVFLLSEGVQSKVTSWTITDSNGVTCSLMDMDATITHPIYDIEVKVPSNAITSTYETCPTTLTVFTLMWTESGFDWEIRLHFNVSAKSDTYTLIRYSGTVMGEDGSVERSWSYKEHSYPTTPITDSFVCSFFVAVRATFSDVRWQPFANLNDGKFGPGKECPRGLHPGVPVAMFIISVVAILCAVLICVFTRL